MLWVVISHTRNILTDCLYYIVEMATWQIIIVKCRKLEQVRPVYDDRPAQGIRDYGFAGNLRVVMEDERMYLNPALQIEDIARRLNTNRTYLSEYFNNVLGKSFYDYINAMRIEKGSIPLMKEHPEYTLEYIARQSGFNTLSTFRRAFVKHTGMQPGRYRLDRQKACDSPTPAPRPISRGYS